jgi:hypothetical protein
MGDNMNKDLLGQIIKMPITREERMKAKEIATKRATNSTVENRYKKFDYYGSDISSRILTDEVGALGEIKIAEFLYSCGIPWRLIGSRSGKDLDVYIPIGISGKNYTIIDIKTAHIKYGMTIEKANSVYKFEIEKETINKPIDFFTSIYLDTEFDYAYIIGYVGMKEVKSRIAEKIGNMVHPAYRFEWERLGNIYNLFEKDLGLKIKRYISPEEVIVGENGKRFTSKQSDIDNSWG